MTQNTENKTLASREEPHPSEAVLESAKAGQRAASEAVRKFANTLDEAIRERREAIREDSALHSLRKTIIDAALEMSDRLVTTQYEFLRSIVRSADQALSKPNGDNV